MDEFVFIVHYIYWNINNIRCQFCDVMNVFERHYSNCIYNLTFYAMIDQHGNYSFHQHISKERLVSCSGLFYMGSGQAHDGWAGGSNALRLLTASQEVLLAQASISYISKPDPVWWRMWKALPRTKICNSFCMFLEGHLIKSTCPSFFGVY